MKTCPQCSTEHERAQPTCSRSCAAKTRTYKPRECKFPKCAIVFTPTTPTPYCSPTHEVDCEQCEELITVRSEPRFKHLCHDCAVQQGNIKAKKTRLEKYGVEHHFSSEQVQEKIKNIVFEKYGVANAAQAEEVKNKIAETNQARYGGKAPVHSDEIKEKIKQTNLLRYGHEYAIASETGKTNIRKTNNERYGVDYSLSRPEIREQIALTNLEKYGVENVFAAQEIKDKIAETLAKNLATNGTSTPRISKINQRFAKIIQDKYSVEVQYEKTFGKFQADLYIEEKDLLIDLNPTVTHNAHLSFSCLINNCGQPCEHKKPAKTYHYERACAAQDNNQSLIQIYDWEDKNKITRLLAGKLEQGWSKYSARKLVLKKISQLEANKFLHFEHIQGRASKQTHCYGLYDHSVLLAVATFGPARFKAKADYEWIRYAVKSGSIIHGAPNHLFKAFLAETTAQTVVSYVDFNHTTKNNIFLNTVGFKEEKRTGPQLVWHNGKTNQKIVETSLLALGADRLLKTNYGNRKESGLNNHDIMLRENFLPIYTAGNRVFYYR